MEVVKQRRQTSDGISPLEIVRKAVANEGFLGLYRGFFSTVFRDIPFSVIQFPLWEALKLYWSTREMREVTSVESALAGAIAGMSYISEMYSCRTYCIVFSFVYDMINCSIFLWNLILVASFSKWCPFMIFNLFCYTAYEHMDFSMYTFVYLYYTTCSRFECTHCILSILIFS